MNTFEKPYCSSKPIEIEQNNCIENHKSENSNHIPEKKLGSVGQLNGKLVSLNDDNIQFEIMPFKNLGEAYKSLDVSKNYNIDAIIEKLNKGEKVNIKIDISDRSTLGEDFPDDIDYFTLHADNKILGIMTVSKENSQINSVQVLPGLVGKGYGSKLYINVNNILISEGKGPLKSDDALSTEAVKVWERFVDSGKAQRIGRSTIRNTYVYEMLNNRESAVKEK